MAVTVDVQSNGFASSAVLRSVLKTLRSNRLWAMATRHRRGGHINTAYFCHTDDLVFYFISDNTSQHVLNFTRTSRVAVAIYDSQQRWDSYHRGLQLFGTCRDTTGARARKAAATYAKRFPSYARYIKSISTAERRRSPYRFYEFRPDTVKLIDEEMFGEEVFVSAEIRRTR